MVTLPQVSSYTPQELETARRLSPAIARYLELIQIAPKDISQELRILRHTAWLESSLAVLFNKDTPEVICKSWSLKTRDILKRAWHHCGLNDKDVALLEMGKLGADELNLSSDIDIFFVSQNDPEKESLKKVRQFVQLVSEVTAFGFCYRIDMDLRPGGSTSPLIISFDQMTNHYGYHGETWERMAIVRQQIHFGPPELIQDVFEFCQKFAFRRHLDYGLFSDLFSMREKIQAHRAPSLNINIKFHPGGIRDLELLVHSLQLIHGGKNKSLRTHSTTQALLTLQTAGWLQKQECDFLCKTYWRYRDIENKIHLHADQHTYEIQLSQQKILQKEDVDEFVKLAQQTQGIIDQALGPFRRQGDFVPETDLQKKFEALQLSDEESLQSWQKLMNTEARSRERVRDEQERLKFLNAVLDQLRICQVDNRLALHHLEKFISTIKAKASFFSLLNQHTELIEEIVWIFSCSPYLAQILINRPELIDSFLLKKLEIIKDDENLFHQSLQDYKLLSELICASAFLRNRSVQALTENLSQTTDTIILELIHFLEKKMNVQLDILTLGKWASQEMGLTSDLDFVFITDQTPNDGHFKTARRFINFLHSSTRQALYNVDLRLRPSGHAGPLLLTISELKKYLHESAQIWERQVYMSNRWLKKNELTHLVTPRALSPEDKTELARIQSQLLTAATAESINLKKSLGGLLHTELTAQIAAMEAQVQPRKAGLFATLEALPDSDIELRHNIYENYQKLRTYQQLLILISGSPSSELNLHSLAFEKICLISRNTPKVLFEDLLRLLEEQKVLLNKLDPLSPGFRIKG